MRKTRQPINLVDLGFEDAVRLKGLASKEKNRKKLFVGIEATKADIQHRLKNLKLIYADAFDRVKRMHSSSVKVMTADFLFTEFKIDGLDLGQLGWRGVAFEKTFMKRRMDLSKEIARVLVPNGRFFVTEYGENLAITLDILKEAGVRVTVKPVPKSHRDKTKFLKYIFDHLDEHPENKSQFQPMQITARKAI